MSTPRILMTVFTLSTVGIVTAENPPDVKTQPIDPQKLESSLFAPEAVPAKPAKVATGSVAAIVNDEKILRSDVNREVEIFLKRMPPDMPPERVAQMKAELSEEATQNLIVQALLVQAANAQAIKVDAKEVDQEIEKIKQRAPPGMKLEDQLAKDGLTMETFRGVMTTNLMIKRLVVAQAEGIKPPEEAEVKEFYEKNEKQFERGESVRASHILISTQAAKDDKERAEKRAKAEALRKQLIGGADFAELAGRESDCPSKAKGGDLGSFTKGNMVPEFEKAAFEQKPGEVGDIVETQFGYHIIKVTSHDQPGKTAFADVKERIAGFLLDQKRREATKDYVQELRAKAKITLDP